eukprot:Colp12_sorted_trinity150504_noHs@17175
MSRQQQHGGHRNAEHKRSTHSGQKATPEEVEAKKFIVGALASVLKHAVERNDKHPGPPCAVTRFHATKAPSVSIRDYLDRICNYAPASKECYVMSLVYMDRMVQRNPNFRITSFNVHRVIITSVMDALSELPSSLSPNITRGVSCMTA